jgi:hypothetical protein
MKPAFVTRVGRRRTHTPDNEQLKDAGLKVAAEQPHIPAAGEEVLAEQWKPKSRDLGSKGELIAPPENPDLGQGAPEPTPKKKRGPRMPRAKISETKLDGSVPVTLGGKLPPVSVLARREFGLRALRR